MCVGSGDGGSVEKLLFVCVFTDIQSPKRCKDHSKSQTILQLWPLKNTKLDQRPNSKYLNPNA